MNLMAQTFPTGKRAFQLGTTWIVILALAAMPILLSVQPMAQSALLATRFDPAKLVLSFVPALDRSGSEALFQIHHLDGTISFTRQGLVFAVPDTNLRLDFIGASPQAVAGVDELPGVANYFIGSDPFQWRTNQPTYGGITYEGLYPGIDLHYSGVGGQLKGTYLVAAGAAPSAIRWRHAGAERIAILPASGDLEITLSNGSKLIEQAPAAWQDTSAGRIAVPVQYLQNADGSLGFSLGAYDAALPLVIDPTLVFGTVLGGSDFEDVEGIAVDPDGNIYLAGTTNSVDFPVLTTLQDSNLGWEDAYIVKIDPTAGSVIYSTYLGGSEDDGAYGLALGGAGQVYLTGNTGSTDFPTQNAAQNSCAAGYGGCTGDAFIAKLNATGDALLYSTYLGGSNVESAEAIAVVEPGLAYVTGVTFSSNFPTHNPYQASLRGAADAFVAILDTTASGSASLIYGSYLGGGSLDFGSDIATGGSGSIFVTGHTHSSDFPLKAPLQAIFGGSVDAFLVKMNAAGSDLTYSTYLGGSGKDYSYSLAVGQGGSAYLTGNTESSNFPLQTPLQDIHKGASDVFVARVAPDGAALEYSTYLGGSGADYGYGIAVATDGSAYVTGSTFSDGFPVKDPLKSYQGNEDAFVAKLAADGSALHYSTFLGGSEADLGLEIALGDPGLAYVAGLTFSPDFPTAGGLSFANTGGGDVFVSVLDDVPGEPAPPPTPAPDLRGSTKEASQIFVGLEDTFTYSITLLNSGTQDAVAEVSDVVPDELAYVDSSVTGGGVYDGGTHTLTWSDVDVAAGSQVELSFQASAAADVEFPTVITNTATISYNGDTLERMAWVVLMSPDSYTPASGPDLRGSLKTASRLLLGPDDTLTYTIKLLNSGAQDAVADVSDAVPVELAYVDSSVTGGGVYDGENHTLTWSGVDVPAASQVDLSFQVSPAVTVTHPSIIKNTATISYSAGTLERSMWITLVPHAVSSDTTLPVVHSLTIDEQDVLYSPQVTLHISATDNVGVEWMYLREWQVVSTPIPHWEVAKSSGWVPYQEHYPWTLGSQSGVHFVGVWVTDGALNHSVLDRKSLDFASLMLTDTKIPQMGLVPYLIYYDEGLEVSATLTPTVGNADLFVWFPGHFMLPDRMSMQPGLAKEEVHFTTPVAGPYIFLVTGLHETTFTLTVTPGGGPRAWSVAGSVPAATLAIDAASQANEALLNEPVFSLIGLDPLNSGTTATPAGPWLRYLPVIGR